MTFRKFQFLREKFQGDKIGSCGVFLGNVKYKWTDINSSRYVCVCVCVSDSLFTRKKSRFPEFYSDKLVVSSVCLCQE